LENISTDRPRFTKQQDEIEQATMADEEKAASLCDLFGQSCAVGNHKIKFLVQQMRLELEPIPNDEKQALVEAQMKCHPDEFSNA
jgi:protein subunit release factor A